MPSQRTNHNKERKNKHLSQKRRARYMKVINGFKRKSPDIYENFNVLVAELISLHPKYLEIMLIDLANGFIHPWSGEYHRRLIDAAHTRIMEATVFK
jgi:hypothetical protein